MTIEVKVPLLPESIADATIAKWHKKAGDAVKRDENLVDLETDKVMLEVPALRDGVLTKILRSEGDTVKAQELIAVIDETASAASSASKPQKTAAKTEETAAVAAAVAPTPAKVEKPASVQSIELSPSVRRLVAEHDLDATQIKGSGKDGRVTKEDIVSYMKTPAGTETSETIAIMGDRPEQRVPMTRLRAKVAERLLQAKNNTAMLTTFNEVNMKPIMDLRSTYKDQFEKAHGVKLGFMSFFVKAAIEALKRFPVVNASIDGNDIVYHGYFDIGIAVSTPRGLVVPILRDADTMNMGDIEEAIADYAEKARTGKLTIEEMAGGTFTITNGGIFGSMLSTPILNPPQCAILGMHNIVKRPVVENDQIVIRPIMYLALSYDHRLIDGRESVGFLLTIKQLLEDPMRLILGV